MNFNGDTTGYSKHTLIASKTVQKIVRTGQKVFYIKYHTAIR